MWKITENEFIKENIQKNGNRFIIGNGYMGYRGTLDEFTKNELVALTIPGLFDQQDDKWIEPVNAPNPYYTKVIVDGVLLDVNQVEVLNHQIELNIHDGVFSRKTTFIVNNKKIIISSSRFISHDDIHSFGGSYQLECNEDVKIELHVGIDLDVWDLAGPHLKRIFTEIENNEFKYHGQTLENHQDIFLSMKLDLKEESTDEITNNLMIKKYNLLIKKDEPLLIHKVMRLEYNTSSFGRLGNYHDLLNNHLLKMNAKWIQNDVKITGDELAQIGIRLSIYHLMIIAPKTSDASISARGVSGQVYKGACFWDTEMFMLPFYLLNDLASAKRIIEYRIKGLKGAIKKAKEFGYEGAFYAWESVRDGYDACSLYNIVDVFTSRPLRTYFKDKQIHISADVVYGLDEYINFTKDFEILKQGGMNLLLEVARFYYSYAYYSPSKKCYVITDVTGPDEYHERVNNNAYTNKMILFSFKKCIEYARYLKHQENVYYESLQIDKFILKLENICENFIPFNTKAGVIEQFDGYFKLEDVTVDNVLKRKLHPNEYLGGANGVATPTQIIKQADVITMLYMFKDEYDQETFRTNFNYYFPRTEHGSSLSACMYALVACMMGEPDTAYPYFLDSALIDYYGKGKEYAGKTYIGGTHPASSGGAYMSVIYGFAGMRIIDDKLTFNPHLPELFTKLEFKIKYLNVLYEVIITKKGSEHQDMSVEIVIFDLDGVIVSTDELHYQAWKKVADQENIFFDRTINHKLRGVSRKESLEIILEKATKIYNDTEKEDLMKRKNQIYIDSLNTLSKKDILEGVMETLQKLKENNILIAIGSSSKNAKIILEKIGLNNTFDFISDGNNITRSKPYPDVFKYVSDNLKINPENCLVVEDAESGIDAAEAAQMIAAGISNASRYHRCDISLENMTDLLKILKIE